MREFVFTVSDSLFRACWQGGLALGLAWGLCRCAPQMPPRLRCWLWRLAYLKLLLALLWATPVSLPLLTAGTPSEVSARDTMEDGSARLPVERSPGRVVESAASAAARFRLRACLLAAWLIGAGVCGLRAGREWRAARRLRHRCAPERDAWVRACCEALCPRFALRRVPGLLTMEGPGSPLLLGGFRPAILLPSALRETCTPAELRLMLAHELAHLSRHDLGWCWLPALAHCLFYFHPLVWMANREWRLAQEVACDELALDVTHAPVGDYGTALLKVAAQSRPIRLEGLAAVNADEFPQTLQRRLLAMKTMRMAKRLPGARALGMGIALAGVIGLVPWRVVAQEPATKSGQEQRAHEGSEANRRQWIAQQLSLTDIQIARIKSVLADLEAQGRALKENDSLDGPAKEARMREVMGAAERRVRETLTPDQLKRLQELGGMRSLLFPGASRVKWTVEDVDREIADTTRQLAQLGLTDTQKGRLNQVFAAGRSQAVALLANRELSDEQRDSALRQLQQTAEQQIQSILTPNQRKRLLDLQLSERLAVIDEALTKRAQALEQVGLTDAQKASLQVFFVSARRRAADLFANRALPEAQRAVSIKMLFLDLEKQTQATLTPAQREQLSNSRETSAAEEKRAAEKEAAARERGE